MGHGFIFLLKERRFLPLFLTQFFGAFNDNAYKLAMLTLISYFLASSQAQSEYFQALAGALFIVPFFLFSATAGQLADKYDKALIARLVKVFELLLMILSGFAFYSGSIFLMMFILTGMGIHSAFFGPIKYSILPDHIPREDLLGATGLIEASTFIAILLGTTFGTLAIDTTTSVPYLAIFMMILSSFIGLVASLFIPPAPSSVMNLKVDVRIWRATIQMLKEVRNQPEVALDIWTISWFWLIGAVIMTKLPDYTHYVLGADPAIFALFLVLFSSGIALSSLLINRILQGCIHLKIVPLAMLFFSVFIFDLYWASPDQPVPDSLLTFLVFFTHFVHWRIAFDLFMLAFCAGLFIVPLYTHIQVISLPEARARTIAANNIYNSLFMVIGTLVVIGLLQISCSIPHVFLIFSVLNTAVAVFFWFKMKNTV